MIVIEDRVKDLEKLEMTFNFLEDSFIGYQEYNKDFYVHNMVITCSTEKEWKKILDELTSKLEQRKQK